MPKPAEVIRDEAAVEAGLRDRKKARRRQDILDIAGALFNENGFDATTMAEIAAALDISPPTVFNYFGSKENILSALLFEGAARERDIHLNSQRLTARPFAKVLGELLCEFSENTLRIAGKRVWRYAESANIRHTQTEFQRRFSSSDDKLLDLLKRFLDDYELALCSDAPLDLSLLANLFFDRWTARYFEFIKDDAMPLAAHLDALRQDTAQMVDLIFAPDFRAHSPLKAPEATT